MFSLEPAEKTVLNSFNRLRDTGQASIIPNIALGQGITVMFYINTKREMRDIQHEKKNVYNDQTDNSVCDDVHRICFIKQLSGSKINTTIP